MNTDDLRLKVVTAILAGGKSSRMGAPKAGTKLATGRTIFDYVHSCAGELKIPCLVVGHAEGIELDAYPELQVIPDEIQERGPVGALLGLFRSNTAHHYLIVACDQPLLSPELLRRLLIEIDERPNVFVNPTSTDLSPIPGLYPATMLATVEQLLQQPRASLRELLARSDARTIILSQEDWVQLRSANTPQDVADMNSMF